MEKNLSLLLVQFLLGKWNSARATLLLQVAREDGEAASRRQSAHTSLVINVLSRGQENGVPALEDETVFAIANRGNKVIFRMALLLRR